MPKGWHGRAKDEKGTYFFSERPTAKLSLVCLMTSQKNNGQNVTTVPTTPTIPAAIKTGVV